MPRKPNYRFERSERERLKAAKKEARLEAKQQQKAAERKPDQPEDGSAAPKEDGPKRADEG